jgi:hypothetical protein
MIDQQGVVRQISWRDLFPWLILLRTFRIAISPSLLALATLAVLILPIGWRAAGIVFLPRPGGAHFLAPRHEIPQAGPRSQLDDYLPIAVREYFPQASTAVVEAYLDLAEPLARLFQLRLTVRELAYYVAGAIWTLLIWAFVGGVITRRAVVQLGTEIPLGIQATATYAARRYLWYFLAPLYPLLGVLLLVIPIALLGLPLRLHLGVGGLLAGLLWIFVALAGVAAMLLLGGLIFGWPLMWPTISAERDGDPFEAFSRSFSYVYGRPLHYVFYVLIALAFGALCWAVVEGAAALVQEFGFWALAWGGGGKRVERLREAALLAMHVRPRTDDGLFNAGATLIGLVLYLIDCVARAFRYTFFWSVASAIYLLLRQDVDDKEMDEIYLDDDAVAPPVPAPAIPPAVSEGAAQSASAPSEDVLPMPEAAEESSAGE